MPSKAILIYNIRDSFNRQAHFSCASLLDKINDFISNQHLCPLTTTGRQFQPPPLQEMNFTEGYKLTRIRSKFPFISGFLGALVWSCTQTRQATSAQSSRLGPARMQRKKKERTQQKITCPWGPSDGSWFGTGGPAGFQGLGPACNHFAAYCFIFANVGCSWGPFFACFEPPSKPPLPSAGPKNPRTIEFSPGGLTRVVRLQSLKAEDAGRTRGGGELHEIL